MTVSISLPLRSYLAFVYLACLAAGCGGAREDEWTKRRPAVYPVRGKVLYKGEPVAEATVSFESIGSDKPVGASGLTDEDGEFGLTTFDPGDGAIAGEHRVMVLKAVIEGEDLSYYDEKSPNYGKVPPPTKFKHLIPEKYSKFQTSGLTAKVESNDDNEITIELKD